MMIVPRDCWRCWNNAIRNSTSSMMLWWPLDNDMWSICWEIMNSCPVMSLNELLLQGCWYSQICTVCHLWLSGPHVCNTTTIQLQYKNFFSVLQLYCTCADLCNTSFLQLAENLQAACSCKKLVLQLYCACADCGNTTIFLWYVIVVVLQLYCTCADHFTQYKVTLQNDWIDC